MSSPRISIITRTKDRPLLLKRAMASVLGQENPPSWEWIVVNDAGDPRPVEQILEPALSRFPDQVQLLNLEASKGMEHASNQGIARSSGEFLVIHDDDDSWHPQFLRKMHGWLNDSAHTQYAGVVCRSTLVRESIDDQIITTDSTEPFNPWLQELSPWRLVQENPFPPISFLFRKSAYQEVGPFDESLPVLGDWEFNMRLILRWPLGLLPEFLANYHHRSHSNGAIANSITASHQRHRHWEKHLRERWRTDPPALGFPAFGQISEIAGHSYQSLKILDQLLSLPMRPGPQL